MRYAIFSDIHGNLEAWNRVIEDIRSLQADVLVCLGDVVGYGPLPEEVLNAIRAETAHFVMGNHDAAAVGIIDPSWFNPHARAVIEWTSGQLSPASHEFLRGVPLSIEGEGLNFVHAEITEPSRFGYITNVEEAAENFQDAQHFVTFVGHTHHPNIFALSEENRVVEYEDNDCTLEENQRYIVNVGSVGEPRNPDDLRARYVIYDSDTRHVTFRKVEFDPENYRRQLQATTLEVTPYFLSAWDHQLGDSSEPEELVIDMEAPVDAQKLKFQFADTARLDSSALRQAAAMKKAARNRGLTMLAIFTSLAVLATAVALFLWWNAQPDDTDPPVIAQPTPASPTPAEPEPIPAPPETEPTPEPEPELPISARYVRIQAPGQSRFLGLSEVQVFSDGDNIAQKGKATQASKLTSQHVAALAVDGFTHDGGATEIAMSSKGKNRWWELDLGQEHAVESLQIWSPSTQQQLAANTEVLLANQQRQIVWKGHTGPPQPSFKFATTASTKLAPNQQLLISPGTPEPDPKPEADEDQLYHGQFVRISKKSESALSLAEVVVVSRGRNITRGGAASQSSEHSDEFPANLAIDGNTDGKIESLSTTHTRAGLDEHWWEVDLGSVNPIRTIEIWNRAKYRDRLQDFTVQILDADRKVIWEQAHGQIPAPKVAFRPQNIDIAWWKMDQAPAENFLIDAMKTHSLEALKPVRKIPNLGPETNPESGEPNAGALSLGIWKEPAMSGFYQLRSDRSFTLEGWFVALGAKQPVLLAGTWKQDGETQQGWRVDLRPTAPNMQTGPMAFYYHNGTEAIQALSKEVPINTSKPHHFAAVWDHDQSANSGEMRLYLNGARIASLDLPHSAIPQDQANRFHIGSNLNPENVGVDEFRFTHTALSPSTFNTLETVDLFYTDFTQSDLDAISGLKLDIPAPAVATIQLDVANRELDITSNGRVNPWATRDNAPIAYTLRPKVKAGETWFVETQMRLNGKIGIQERIVGVVFYPNRDGAGGSADGMEWSVEINEWNDRGVEVQNFHTTTIGDSGQTRINPNPLVKNIREVLFRIEVTEKGATDAYRIFYRLPDGSDWIEFAAFNSKVDNSRVGLFLKNGNLTEPERSVSFKYFRVGLKKD